MAARILPDNSFEGLHYAQDDSKFFVHCDIELNERDDLAGKKASSDFISLGSLMIGELS